MKIVRKVCVGFTSLHLLFVGDKVTYKRCINPVLYNIRSKSQIVAANAHGDYHVIINLALQNFSALQVQSRVVKVCTLQ